MADATETVIEVPAEALLAEPVAVEAVAAEAAAVVEAPAEAAPIEFPARAKRGRKPRAEAPAPVVAAPVKDAAAVKAPAKTRAPAKKRAASVKQTISKKTQAAPKTAPKKPVSQKITSPISQLKDTIMASKQTQDFTAGIQTAVSDVQAKAKEAFEKGTSALGEANAFAKGNVEAIVESGKVLSAGLQELGSSYAAEAKTVFETLTADVKEIAAAKNPTDFFKLQGEVLRRNFDAAVAQTSKNSEAMMKLATDTFAPITGRVNEAVAKIKSAA